MGEQSAGEYNADWSEGVCGPLRNQFERQPDD